MVGEGTSGTSLRTWTALGGLAFSLLTGGFSAWQSLNTRITAAEVRSEAQERQSVETSRQLERIDDRLHALDERLSGKLDKIFQTIKSPSENDNEK